MEPEQLRGVGRRLADPARQGGRSHAVLNSQDASLEEIPLGPVGLLGSVGRYPPGLLAERKVRVSAPVGVHHRPIAGEGGRNPEFLLAPIDIGHGHARLRLDEAPEPR